MLLLNALSVVAGVLLGGMFFFASKLFVMGLLGFAAAIGFGYLLEREDPMRRRLALRVESGDVVLARDHGVSLARVEDVSVVELAAVDGERRACVKLRVDDGETELLLDDVLHDDAVECAARVRRFFADQGWNGR